jgi:hypothetical protein
LREGAAEEGIEGLLALIVSAMLAQGPPEQAAPGPATPAAQASVLDELHGSLDLRYRTRWTSDASDAYLFEFLTSSYGNPEKDLVSFSTSARFNQDLVGLTNVQGFYPFQTLETTYRSRATQWLYTAYMDLSRPLPGLYVRAGRQVVENLPEAVPMDGGSVWFKATDAVTMGGFGGVPVNLFESSPHGDVMGGGWLEVVPWLRGKGHVEYLHIEDENVFGNFKNDLAAVSFEERFGSFLAYARYANLDGRSRDVSGRLTGSFPDLWLIASVQATYQFETVKALSYAIDPYATFMTSVEPYFDLTLRASWVWGVFGVDGTFTTRELVRGATEETYNHAFTHWQIAPHLDGWPIKSVSVTLTGDFWESKGLRYGTAGGDLSWRVHREITLSAGTSYALYSVDALTGEEHDRVRIFYGMLQWKLDPLSSIDLRFTYEENDVDRFRTIELGARRAF